MESNRAILILSQKIVYDAGHLMQLKIWDVPTPVPPSGHRFKYSLVYISHGRRVIGFDNERGKGDHFHIDDQESPYAFSTIEQLVRDFFDATDSWRKSHENIDDQHQS